VKPKNSSYWLLDAVAGWRISSKSNVAFTLVGGDITLDPLPGSAVILGSDLTGVIACPIAIASHRPDQVLVLDQQTDRITVLDLADQTARVLTAFGGRGRDARSFHSPAGIAVLRSGAIAVADTGNHRVLVFSAPPYHLLKVVQVGKPCAIAADDCENIFVLDRAARQVFKIAAGDDSPQAMLEEPLKDPQDLAASAKGIVAVVDGRNKDAAVVVLGTEMARIRCVESPASVAFDDSGNLFVGTANSLIAKLEPDSTALEGYRVGGEGVTDIEGTVRKMAFLEAVGLVVLLKDNETGKSYLATVNPAGSFRRTGIAETEPLDSGIENCIWHRVQIMGTVPTGTSLLVESMTGATRDADFGRSSICTFAGADNPDCLIQSAPGRYLKLRLTLRSSGEVSPILHAVKLFFPRLSYLQYLPAVFQDDPESRSFLDRFLSLFQTSFDAFDERLDSLWETFDPSSVSERYLPWLAAWLAVPFDPGMPLAKKRALLKSAFQTYLMRGTVRGFEKVVKDYTGIGSIRILEHFRLRDWPQLTLSAGLNQGARLWSRNFYQRLQLGVNFRLAGFKLTGAPEPAMEPFDWGAHSFTVFFPADPYTVASTQALVKRVVDREKPAYAEAFLCPVFPRMRVGVQATLGVDAVVGEVNPMVLNREATLGYDSVLSRSHLEMEILSLGVSPRPSLGVNSRLL